MGNTLIGTSCCGLSIYRSCVTGANRQEVERLCSLELWVVGRRSSQLDILFNGVYVEGEVVMR